VVLARVLLQCLLFSDSNSASASHSGSTKSGYFQGLVLIYHLLDGFECSMFEVYSFKNKILTASARDISASEFRVVFLLLLSVFYITG